MIDIASNNDALAAEVERLRKEVALLHQDERDAIKYRFALAEENERLEADLAAARALNEAMIANLPGPYYMDPPDGGSVNPEEQMRRLAKDAERYRWIKKQSIKMATAKDDFSCYDADYTVSILFRKRPPSLNGYILVAPQGNELDAAIDAALDKQRSGE